MRILGIETSCDETAAAVIEGTSPNAHAQPRILSHVVATSAEMQAKFGGVIPEQAAREQLAAIIPVIKEALERAAEVGNWKLESGKRNEKLEVKSNVQLQNLASNSQPLISNLDAIAVTSGPGLIGSLLVGVETAKTLARLWQKPIIPVNHLLAHIYANWVSQLPTTSYQSPTFPALALVASGGHTDLVLMENHGKLKWIGGTRDDAAGEAFDKCARLLKLPYPGGPSIAAAAAKFLERRPENLDLFPRPMINDNNFDFSFSGLKTAVLRTINNQQSTINKIHLAAEVQEAIVDVLVKKTLDAVKKFQPKTLLLAGGVSANLRLREKFKLEIGSRRLEVEFRAPGPKLCTDNAATIATYAFYNFKPVPWPKITTNPELTIAD